MENMDGVHLLVLLVALLGGIQCQTISPSSVDVPVGDDVSLECTTLAAAGTFIFTWIHVTREGDTVNVFSGGIKTPPEGYDNYILDEDTSTQRSTLNINNILYKDAGDYTCEVSGQAAGNTVTVTVEVGSTETPPELESIDGDTNYRATCDAIGSYPTETITWILDDVIQPPSASIEEIDPDISDDSLFDLRSIFTFPATVDNYNVMLDCNISGHAVSSLNRQVSRRVDVHNPPEDAGVMVGFNSDSSELTIECNINGAVEEAVPALSNYYIYDSNNTLLHMSTNSVNSVTIPEPEQETDYTCVGGNYLGNTTNTRTYDPTSTTTPIPPTGSKALGPGPIAGIVIGALLFIIIIIVLIIVFVLKPECVSGLGSSSGGGGGPKKHGSSSVGSSNGNDKDNFKPTPQPRQSSIQHTNENPGMAEYAMVDRKPKASSGGDMPDTRGNGAGQNEQPGMHYADLDLTAGAGHTEEKVPQNPDNVVVYSSILV